MYHHFKHRSAPGLEKLWVVVVVSNPARYRSRYALYERFKLAMDRAGANVLLVELALGDRPFEVTEAGNPLHVQLRTWDEIWHKENMINVGISRLPADWQYVAWIDADVEFMRQDWAEETVHQLQHHQMIQLFQNAIDLGPNGEIHKTYDGFGWAFMTHQPPPYTVHDGSNYGPHWHPGYAWAARREAIDDLGGLIDTGVMGASDHHMAWALIGKVVENTPTNVSSGYLRHLVTWQERALTHLRMDIGFMPGTIYHHWHGRKADRRYRERWDIIHKWNFDPDKDLKKDSQGLYQFTHEGARMRNDVREYFHQRNEDSTEL